MAFKREIPAAFSVTTMFLFVGSMALFFAGGPVGGYYPREVSSHVDSNGTNSVAIHWGIRRHRCDSALDRLDFVVIERWSNSAVADSQFKPNYSGYEPCASLRHAGREFALPGTAQLIQVDDSTLSMIDANVGFDSLATYIKQAATKSNIADLAALDKQRRRPLIMPRRTTSATRK